MAQPDSRRIDGRYLPCLPGTGADGQWACAVCGQPGSKDCVETPHLSTDPKDWHQPDLVQEWLDG